MNLDHLFPAELKKKWDILDVGYFENSKPLTYDQFKNWNQNVNQDLFYLKDHRSELRSDLKNIFPPFQSGLIFLFSYAKTKKYLLFKNFFKVCAYALGFDGLDYHLVLKKKLQDIEAELKERFPNLIVFPFTDTQSILERDFAYQAGMGWIGRNSMLINPKYGSYFIISGFLLNQKLIDLQSPKKLETNHCGTCRKCIEACPTNAITNENTLIPHQCLSFFTIEAKADFIFNTKIKNDTFHGEIFGCDICQDVCPFNHHHLNKLPEVDDNDFLAIQKDVEFFQQGHQKILEKFSSMSGREYLNWSLSKAWARPRLNGMIKNLKKVLSL